MDDFARPRVASVEDPLRLAVFISGSGSGMEALLRHQTTGCAHMTVLVISNKADVKGLDRATQYDTPNIVVEVDSDITDATERRREHESRLLTLLDEHDVEVVILSGYMRVLTSLFVRSWKGRLLNIHPSLLPKYPGAHAHRDALADGAVVTGCTVHLVDEGVDSGPVLAQREVLIESGETVESLQEKVKVVEHQLYPTVIDAYATGAL